jgi:catechol 2,3-dioxygenase-like lactoylglutathione lyase family enzyme
MKKMMPIKAVESVQITVADMDRSIYFYTTILACEKVSDRQISGVETDLLYGLSDVHLRVVKLQLGDESFELIEFLTPKGRPMPVDSRSNDRWFQHIAIVVRDMEQAYQQLHHHWVSQISPNPQTLPAWNPVAGGIESFYFKDPDGHNLELIHFPASKGDLRWQKQTKSLFLGIDHTAIVVADTATSLAFYCDLLGMKLEQQSLNSGSEQEKLSDVPHPTVKISSLNASAGWGIELLEYIEPNDGRSMPIDTHTNDIWCCQTIIIITENLTSKIQQLQTEQLTLIPTDVTLASESNIDIGQSFLIKDPDEHIIKLIQQ